MATRLQMAWPVSLPEHPLPLDLHIRELLEFVSAHQWVYDVQVTRIFQLHWWDKIPLEWREPLLELSYEELRELPYGFTKAAWPGDLQRFISDSVRLSLSRTPPPGLVKGEVSVEPRVREGMTPKKLHEVGRLAGLVSCVCQEVGCEVVLDVGSGLGYLGHCLSQQCGVSVVGLEREGTRVEAATERRGVATRSHDSHMTKDFRDDLPSDISTPYHVSVEFCIGSSLGTSKLLSELLDQISRSVCMTGLHCCGDLTPSILHLLHSLPHPSLKAVIVFGCCYHRMTLGHEIKGSNFVHFPMSSLARGLLREARTDFTLNVFALRLAAQETRARWHAQSRSDHEDHQRRVSFRAVLEAVCSKPLPRKALRGLNCTTFEEYAAQVSHNLQDPLLRQRMLDYYSENKNFNRYIEPFTALQVCMQGVLESLVLLDRLVCVREWGVKAELVPVFDEVLSPRNMAILAYR